MGEPVGTKYTLWENSIKQLLQKHLPLNFKYFRPRKLSSYSDHERAILAQLDTPLNVQCTTSNNVLSAKHSSSTGSWGISKQFPNWHRLPYFHLLLIDADENDYKKHLRPITKKWIKNRRRDNDSHAIVYVHHGKMKKKMLKTGTILDKLRADASKDTVCNIDLERTDDNDIADLLALLKEGIFARFIYNLKKFSHQLHILEQTWNLPGWNFPQYFIIREGLALTCEMFALYRHAYSHYVALETMISDDAIAATLDAFDSPNTPLSASATPANGYIPSQHSPDSSSSPSSSGGTPPPAGAVPGKDSPSTIAPTQSLITPQSTTQPPPPKLSHRYQTQFPQIINDVSTLPIEPILEMSLNENRKLINAHKISRFDLYNYLFSRISILLFRMHLPDHVARKAIAHFSQLPAKMLSETVLKSKTVAQMDRKVYQSYIHAWAYSNILSVVEQCQQQAANSLDHETLTKLSCILGDLFILARDHLEALGRLYHLELGWEGFTIQENFEVSSPFPGSPRESAAHGVSSPTSEKHNAFDTHSGSQTSSVDAPEHHHSLPFATDNFDTAQRLDNALSKQDTFDQVFLELSAAASRSYQNGDRKRLHLKLQGDIAAVRFKQRNFDETITLLISLIEQLTADGWEQLAGYFQIRLAECQRLTGKKRDYLHTILAVLKNRELPDARHHFFSQQFVDYASKHLTEQISFDNETQFAVTFPSVESSPHNGCAHLNLHIEESHIPCHFSSIFLHALQDVQLVVTLQYVSDSHDDSLPSTTTFSIDHVTIPAGESDAQLPIFLKKLGVYKLTSCRVNLAHVSFYLDVAPLEICVHSSDPGIQVSHSTAKCMVVGQKQWIHLSMNFTKYSAHGVKMSFTSSPMLELCWGESVYECLETLSSEEEMNAQLTQSPESSVHSRQSTLKWDKLELTHDDKTVQRGEVPALTCWHMLIPLICHKQTSAQCVVEKLTATIQFHKTTDEPFTIAHDFHVSFYDPFMHFVYETRLSECETLLQISMECTNQESVKIVSHSLECTSHTDVVVEDLNRASLTQHQTLHPENNLSFVFLIRHGGRLSESNEACANFDLHFHITDERGHVMELDSLPTAEKNVALVYHVGGIRWNVPLAYEYRVTAQIMEPIMTLMHPVRFEFFIESLTGVEEVLMYEVKVNENLFFVSGEKKKSLKTGGACGSCTLIPIASGYVELPSIRLYHVGTQGMSSGRVDRAHIEYRYPSGGIVFVAPPKHDHVDALWKVEGDGFGTETSHVSQVSLRTPVVNFGDGGLVVGGVSGTFDSPARMHHEEGIGSGGRTPSTRSHHSRSRSDMSVDSLYSVSLSSSIV